MADGVWCDDERRRQRKQLSKIERALTAVSSLLGSVPFTAQENTSESTATQGSCFHAKNSKDDRSQLQL